MINLILHYALILFYVLVLPVFIFIVLLILTFLTTKYCIYRYGVTPEGRHVVYRIVFSVVKRVARIYHGYEIIGLENIPARGPALLIAYHGPFPVDPLMAYSLIYQETGRLATAVMNRKMFLLPVFRNPDMQYYMGFCDGSFDKCVQILKDGNLLAIAPGGNPESYLSGPNYNIEWSGRTGFAKLALEARVPIIPVLTENIREVTIKLNLGTRIMTWLRHKRLPFFPCLGYLPVKLRTHLGTAIPYDPSLTPQMLADKTKTAIEELIATHQRRPGSIVQALLDRFRSRKYIDKTK